MGEGDALPTVVIPVFNAPEELDQCLGSVLATVPGNTRVIVIDDGSTDALIPDVLRKWRQQAGPGWQFLANDQNLGFVATVNRGMSLADGNVVLLNSDTRVTSGWLLGLQRCLDSDPAIATATPWTNNGEIASIPRFCEPNEAPENPETIARHIASTGRPSYPEIPTAVGFCMAISRVAIDRLGMFDVETFGAGYGEENDFSMRALQAGLRNVLCDDVYVVHLGGRSFGPLGLKPDESTMNRLLALHPDYLARVQEFIADDPLKGRREELLQAFPVSAVQP